MRISKKIPIPKRNNNPKGRPRKYPLDELKVGHSFQVPVEKKNALNTCVNYYKRKSGKNFTLRTLGDIVRVWRTH